MTHKISPRTQVSLHPHPQAVTTLLPKGVAPQDRAQKLRVIEAFEGIRVGKLPTNSQFDQFLFAFIKAPGIDKRRHLMSEDGQKLVEDVRAFLRTLRRTIKAKNGNEVIQSFAYHVHLARSSPLRGDLWEATGTSPEKIAAEAKQGADALFTIGKLLVTNSELRSVVSDIITIVRDMSSEVLTKDEETSKSPEEEGARMRHGKGRDPRDSGYDDFARSSNDFTWGRRFSSHNDDVPPGWRVSSEDAGETSVTHSPHRRLAEKLPEPVKERVQQVSDYLQNRLNEEEQEHLIDRLKLVLTQVQRQDDYQAAVDYVFMLLSEWTERIKVVGEESRETKKVLRKDANVVVAQREFMEILENIAGNSLDNLRQKLSVLAEDIEENPKLNMWFGEVQRFVKRLLKDPTYLDSPQSSEKSRDLLHKVRPLFEERYSRDLNDLLDELQSFWEAFNSDHYFRELNECLKAIHNDLWLDERGRYTMKPNLFLDFRAAILPALLDEIKFIPIPRIAYSDSDWEVIVDNIVIASENFMPNIIEGKARNTFRFSPKSEIEDFTSHGITLRLEQIQAFVNDIRFSYNHKHRFPKIKDSGVADILIGGKGITVTLKLAAPAERKGEAFSIKKVHVNISNMKINIRQSRYETFYNVIHPYVIRLIRRELSRAIERKVYNALLYLNKHMVSMVQPLVGGDLLSIAKLGRQRSRGSSFSRTRSTSTTTRKVSKDYGGETTNKGYEDGTAAKPSTSFDEPQGVEAHMSEGGMTLEE
jgi:hypothetical protein